MSLLITNILKKYLGIITLIIFIFSNSTSFAAVKQFVDDINIPDDYQREPTGLIFNPDGTKMYSTGINSLGDIIQYTLTTPFDISTATLSSEKCRPTDNNGTGDVDTMNIRFNSDGTKFFLMDTKVNNQETIDTYSLSTAYDISTCSYIVGSAQDFGGNLEMRDMQFNQDGTMFFIFNQGDATGRIQGTYEIIQYSLGSAYDLSNPTLVTRYGGPPPDGLKGIQAFAQGMTFSFDGSRMFLTGNDTTNDVQEFLLSTPFDLTDTITYTGKYDAGEISRLSGLAFSSDGMKMFLTDWTNNATVRGIYEYDLTCPFGVITCPDPSTNKDDVALVQTQSEAAKRLIQHNTSTVLNRMEWLRRNKEKKNLTNQNLKVQFSNQSLNSLVNSLASTYFANYNSSNAENFDNVLNFWSEGTISIGKTGDTKFSSSKKVSTTGFTIGADKRNADNLMRGIAIRFGNDDVDVGSVGSALDMRSLSFTFYETKPKGNNKFLDNLAGLSLLKSDIVNSNGSSSNTGERDGVQLFGAINLRNTLIKENVNFTPKFKINYGLTHLSDYTEQGNESRMKYEDQIIGNFITSVGSSIQSTINLETREMIPFFDFEYSADMSPSTKQKLSYVSNNESFTFRNINNATQNVHLGIGLDIVADDGSSLMTKYSRNQAQHGGYEDSFIISFDYSASETSSYNFSLQDTSTEFAYKKELQGLNIDVTSNFDFFKDEPDYGLYLKAYSHY